jgi:methylmalonyl-CoA mutase
MKGKKEDILFADFPPLTKEDWKAQVISDLKGADFDKKLVWKTLEGFDLQPLYTKEDINGLEYLKNYHSSVAKNPSPTGEQRGWLNIEKIDLRVEETKANELAQKALNTGADGILVDISGNQKADIKAILKGIHPECCAVFFRSLQSQCGEIRQWLSTQRDVPAIMGGIVFDPLSSYSINGSITQEDFDEVLKNIEFSAPIEKFFGLSVSGSSFADAGSSVSQELAFTLNALVEYLDKLTAAGLSAETILKNTSFHISIGTQYFMEIAKLRALRILLYQVAQAYGVSSIKPGDFFIHSQSSRWTKTTFDPYVNMLRNTTEAMSAIIGGCNSICILPYNEYIGLPDPQSRRISRNIPNMLKEESYFDKIVDPAAGSYYIETITDKLVDSAWTIFNTVESQGGFVESFKKGFIQSEIEALSSEKDKRIASRREILVGINEYPNTKEKVDSSLFALSNGKSDELQLLRPRSAAELVESMRMDTEKYVSKHGEENRPKVFLAKFGSSAAMKTARAMFSGGFLGCAGFNIEEGKPLNKVEEAVQQALESKSQIVVMCASDEDYVENGDVFAKQFRAAKTEALLIVAGNPTDAIEKLQSAGVDDFIHLRKELVSTLRSFQEKLNLI